MEGCDVWNGVNFFLLGGPKNFDCCVIRLLSLNKVRGADTFLFFFFSFFGSTKSTTGESIEMGMNVEKESRVELG